MWPLWTAFNISALNEIFLTKFVQLMPLIMSAQPPSPFIFFLKVAAMHASCLHVEILAFCAKQRFSEVQKKKRISDDDEFVSRALR